MSALEYARQRLAKARELIGGSQAWADSFEGAVEFSVNAYGIREQWLEIASGLVAGGVDRCEAKMAAFWAARRFYAPENDGGMQAAADALAEENSRIGAELDEEEYAFRKDWESRL